MDDRKAMNGEDSVRLWRANARHLEATHAYDPAREHDACGVGLIAAIDGRPRREVVVAGINALKAVWHQKWFVHRRLRPEEYAGRVHVRRRRGADYPIHSDVLESEALRRVSDRFGSDLLPQVPREDFVPRAGSSSNRVTTGPGRISRTSPLTEKSASTSSSRRAVPRSTVCVSSGAGFAPDARFKRLSGGAR